MEPPCLNRWRFRKPPLLLASSNVTFVFHDRLWHSPFPLRLCAGVMLWNALPGGPNISLFDFLRLPGQYSIMIEQPTVIVSTNF